MCRALVSRESVTTEDQQREIQFEIELVDLLHCPDHKVISDAGSVKFDQQYPQIWSNL